MCREKQVNSELVDADDKSGSEGDNMRGKYIIALLIAIIALVLYTEYSGKTIFDYIPDVFFGAEKSNSQQFQIPNKPVTTTRKAVVTTSPVTRAPVTTTTTVTTEAYIDKRVPNFVRNKKPEYKDIKVEWISHDYMYSFSITMHIDKHMYEYYRSLPRYYDFKELINYVNDDNNKQILKSIADSLTDLGNKSGYDKSQIAQEAICFVQAIPYTYDIDSTGQKEFPKYPLETIYDYGGDCEDSSLLLVGILRELNFGCCLFKYEGHIAIGILGADDIPGTYYEYKGKRYYYVETTNTGWTIGDLPDEMKGQAAQVLEIR